MSRFRILTIALAILVISTVVQSVAFAVGSSGFENASYSARSLGKGNAVVADPEEASTVAFNPAGLTELDGTQIESSVIMIAPITSYEGASGTSNDGASTPFSTVPTTFVALATPIDNFKVGLGANSP